MEIRANDLISSFERYLDQINILSLDCFDTILWRKTHQPIDVFYDLRQRPTFKTLPFTANMRIQAETNARKLNLFEYKGNEVKVNEIYSACYPHISSELHDALAEEELKAEIETCYAFPPIIELIRFAHAKNKKIIIVSDTYFDKQQLQRLLVASALPKDVLVSIDSIFCSCEYGRSKRNGLFQHVLKTLNVPAQSILHIGDNPVSDYAAAKLYQLNALYLKQYDEEILKLLNLQATSASFLDPSIHYSRSLSSPFKSVLALKNFSSAKPEQLIGYATIGPILYACGRFLCDEVEQLKKSGKNVNVLFLMRDAYLPSKVCEVLMDRELGKRVYISRFAAYAASFRSEKDINRYLADVIHTNRFYEIGKQLLIPHEVLEPLVKVVVNKPEPMDEFVQFIRKNEITQIILKNSSDYRARLKCYLENSAGIKKGDTLVFVDLGYFANVQRLLEPVFREEFEIEVIGRYLISLDALEYSDSRSGLLDVNSCDERMMRTLVSYISLFEQICTSGDRSVVDYSVDGKPIFADIALNDAQNEKLKLVQAECLQFALDAKNFFQSCDMQLSKEMLKDAAMVALGRFLFLPTPTEIQYFQSFQVDLNLGTKETYKAFDQEDGLKGLRKCGFLFPLLEKNSQASRTNSPIELRSAGIELTTALLAQYRFEFEINPNDLNYRRESLKAIVIQNGKPSEVLIAAQATHDGYFSLNIPLGKLDFNVGILFGQRYRWVQFESVELINMKGFLTKLELQYTEDYWQNIIFDKMVDKGDKLYECLSNSSLVMVNAVPKNTPEKYVLRIVFRPISRRQEADQFTSLPQEMKATV